MIKYPNKSSWNCYEGWHPIIEDLIHKLNIICEDYQVGIIEIKEKFGGLRVAVDNAILEEVYALIREYEDTSYITCEVCGAKGTYRGSLSWKRTLCDKHFHELLKEERKYWGFSQWKNHIIKTILVFFKVRWAKLIHRKPNEYE